MDLGESYKQGVNAGKGLIISHLMNKIEQGDYSTKEHILKLLMVEANKVLKGDDNEK